MAEEIRHNLKVEEDSQSSSRKEDHIDLAFKSAVSSVEADARFDYEPMFNAFPSLEDSLPIEFLGRTMQHPIWVSSMTGGTEKAKDINKNLAIMCRNHGLGMGLGSCRPLLYEDKRFHEFDIRKYLGDQPLMANLGIAQIEELIDNDDLDLIQQLVEKLQADGLIIHINPLQEWMQPEGDKYKYSPLETVKAVLDKADYHVIVKEVGQGFGPESLKALLALPIAALDLAGFGGTNFSKLELLRSDQLRMDAFKNVLNLGHSCEDMIDNINMLMYHPEYEPVCQQLIISGGVKGFLDGYYLMGKSKMSAIYAQASGFLKYALEPDQLDAYIRLQLEGLKMAEAFLKIKA